MKILICVKCIAYKEMYEKSFDGKFLRSKEGMMVNPYDWYAIEAALQIKEMQEEPIHITVLSMGPASSKEALKQTFYVGVDEVVLLSDECFAGADTIATGYTLMKAIESMGSFELILCGQQSINGDTGQISAVLAAKLNLSVITCVTDILEVSNQQLLCQRKTDTDQQRIQANYPVVIGTSIGMNTPRSASLKLYARCKNREVRTLSREDIQATVECCGQRGSPTRVVCACKHETMSVCERYSSDYISIEQLSQKLIQDGILCSN